MATCTLALSSMAAIAAPANHLMEQRIESDKATTEDFANTTLQQRIELRKKTKAHWRDPPASDRAARAKREETAQQAPAGKGSGRDTR